MPHRSVNLYLLHCSATPNGKSLAVRDGAGRIVRTPVQVIDDWHKARGFDRDERWRARFNPQLEAIGYHYFIEVRGGVLTGRHPDERGAHARGYNRRSIGICMEGIDAFTIPQWNSLRVLIHTLKRAHGDHRPIGHRDCSPDADRDGTIEPHEWLKTCPGFDVTTWWLQNNMQPLPGHICEVQP